MKVRNILKCLQHGQKIVWGLEAASLCNGDRALLEGFPLHFCVRFHVHVRCLDADVPEPCANRCEVDAGTKQIHRACMALMPISA